MWSNRPIRNALQRTKCSRLIKWAQGRGRLTFMAWRARQRNLHRYTPEIQDLLHHPQCNGVVSHGVQFGGLWVFANHTLKTLVCFTLVCFHAQIVVHAGNICTWQSSYDDYQKTRRPPNSAPCGDQDGAGSGIACVCLWGLVNRPLLNLGP